MLHSFVLYKHTNGFMRTPNKPNPISGILSAFLKLLNTVQFISTVRGAYTKNKRHCDDCCRVSDFEVGNVWNFSTPETSIFYHERFLNDVKMKLHLSQIPKRCRILRSSVVLWLCWYLNQIYVGPHCDIVYKHKNAVSASHRVVSSARSNASGSLNPKLQFYMRTMWR